MMRHGLLLLAHGARDAAWARPFEAVSAVVRRRAPSTLVQTAYLEHMSPTLDAGCDLLVQSGCLRIDVVPLFLGSGGHVLRDVPLALDRFRARHAGIEFRLHPPIGESDIVVDAMAALALDATARP